MACENQVLTKARALPISNSTQLTTIFQNKSPKEFYKRVTHRGCCCYQRCRSSPFSWFMNHTNCGCISLAASANEQKIFVQGSSWSFNMLTLPEKEWHLWRTTWRTIQTQRGHKRSWLLMDRRGLFNRRHSYVITVQFVTKARCTCQVSSLWRKFSVWQAVLRMLRLWAEPSEAFLSRILVGNAVLHSGSAWCGILLLHA